MTISVLCFKGFKDYNLFEETLNNLEINFNEIITNTESIAYTLSKEYSYNKNINVIGMTPKWKIDNEEAEHILIKNIFTMADVTVFFHNAKDKNLMEQINKAIDTNKLCYVYRTDLNKLKKYQQLTLNFEF